jgi:hypothetical protein
MSLSRDTGFYLFTFADETGVLFEVHANTIAEAEGKLVDILNLAEDDSRRELHWQNWTPNIASDGFKYGNFRKLLIGPRVEADPFIRPVQK